jgi:REP element-mobilizing transposase RayT
MTDPIAYFITFTTYGTWLHGRAPGSVDREHNEPGTPCLPPSIEQEESSGHKLRQPPYLHDGPRRQVVLQTILEVARHRKWKVWAVHVRTNHVHVVITATVKAEKVMADFKAWASRRLREEFAEDTDRDRWTQHGSTKHLWNEQSLTEKSVYVLDGQGDPMARYDGRQSEPEA